MRWYQIRNSNLVSFPQPPEDSRPILLAQEWFMPDFVSLAHASLHQWQAAGRSTGSITPGRLWIDPKGDLAIRFEKKLTPPERSAVGEHQGLAAWLVLLDTWMDTFVVVARARAIWNVEELAGTLPFVNPAFLPEEIVRLTDGNWERVARGLAAAVADGPLRNAGPEPA